MKSTTLIVAMLLLSAAAALAQSTDSLIFSHAQGLKQPKATFYEVEGYMIFDESPNIKYDDKGIKRIRKHYKIPSEINGTRDANLKYEHTLLEFDVSNNGVSSKASYYFLPTSNGRTRVIGMQTALSRKKDVEQLFVHAILDSAVPESVYEPKKISGSVKFAGRSLNVSDDCVWDSVHCISCPPATKLNWAEFRSNTAAQEMIDNYLVSSSDIKNGTVVNRETVDINFEGVATKAVKMTIKAKNLKVGLGTYPSSAVIGYIDRSTITVYLITAYVRNRYIACVASQYKNDTRLPGALLQNIMIFE